MCVFATPSRKCVDAAFHLGNHALVNNAARDELLRLRRIERWDKLAFLVLNALDIAEEDQLLGLERARDFTRSDVRIDVVSLPFAIEARRRDHRNKSGTIERAQDVDVHFDHIANQAYIDLALVARPRR